MGTPNLRMDRYPSSVMVRAVGRDGVVDSHVCFDRPDEVGPGDRFRPNAMMKLWGEVGIDGVVPREVLRVHQCEFSLYFPSAFLGVVAVRVFVAPMVIRERRGRAMHREVVVGPGRRRGPGTIPSTR